MTQTPIHARRNLLMYGHTSGKRSAVTCHLKCANACFHPVPNTSDNATFREIAGAALSRRAILGLAGAGALTVATTLPDAPVAHAAGASGGGIAFTAIKPVEMTLDAVTVPKGWTWAPIIRWGDAVLPGAPTFDVTKQSARDQVRQFGYNNDYTDILPIGDGARRAVLVCNHEYVNPGIMFPPAMDASEALRVALAAHGLSVVELERSGAGRPWKVRPVAQASLNRRIHGSTEFRLDGPAAGSPLLRTVADPTGRVVRGTFGNCSGGTTPWGTILSGEENFNGYFRTHGTSAGDQRYGLGDADTTYGFESIQKRFDARNAGYENEPNRFGWIVEVDPMEPDAMPVKHTAMGRLKHEGANVIVAKSGHVVAYMGDDERFDYLYKFVSEGTYRADGSAASRAHNKTLLTRGDLYVAKFTGDSPAGQIDGSGHLPADGQFDGSGHWVALTKGGKSMVPGMGITDVLVYTRLAADKMGATKMDRCEDVQPSLATGRVYVVCTNNSKRGLPGEAEGPTEVNPRTENKDGHIVEIIENGDQTSTNFGWRLLLVCGDPAADNTYFAGYPKSKVSPISCPDNIAFDSQNNMWIATDGMPSALALSDGLFKVPLAGAQRGHVQQFLAVPRDAETCGPVVHDKDGLVFVAVQHPGEEGSWEAQNSYFPDYVKGTAKPGQFKGPRPAIIQVYQA